MQFARPFLGASIAGALLLSGCTTDVEPTTTPTTTPTPTASETTPAAETFSAPADCTTILPADQVTSYASEDIVLLAGPGGIYGNELIPDPTPETLAGGISCYFGYDSDDPNQIQIYSVVSVAPVGADTQADIVQSLIEQGLNEGTNEVGESTYSILGDTDANVPAMYNVVNDESWISVISVYGGETFFQENVAIAGLVHDQVYN